jgi:phenylacetate-coenzyme A ligase PaaK-like adenylate-forming protein
LNTENYATRLFSITNGDAFDRLALEVFHYQAGSNPVYRDYLRHLGISPGTIKKVSEIPFLPISFFKTHPVISGSGPVETTFLSSGTTSDRPARHHIPDLSLYDAVFTKGVERFYGRPDQYAFLALLPSYLERTGSSLVYMADKLIRLSSNVNSGFYLDTLDELISKTEELEKARQQYILLGVTYALLDLAEIFVRKKIPALNHAILMETGGMKGKRREMIREELHQLLKASFGLNSIHSEYGMTELLSQAYSKGEGLFSCPPWMRIYIRDTNDPYTLLKNNRTGGINIIDLANIHSCCFLATQDLGRKTGDNTFEVLGRFDESEQRGCNLLIME